MKFLPRPGHGFRSRLDRFLGTTFYRVQNVGYPFTSRRYIITIIQELHAAVGSGPAWYYVANKYIIGLATCIVGSIQGWVHDIEFQNILTYYIPTDYKPLQREEKRLQAGSCSMPVSSIHTLFLLSLILLSFPLLFFSSNKSKRDAKKMISPLDNRTREGKRRYFLGCDA